MTTSRTRISRTTTARLLGFVAALGGVFLLTAGPAAAHVTVNPGTAEPGSFSQITFRVPNERSDATTTKIQVTFPAGQPLAFASVRPVPGWQVQVLTTKLATPLESDDGPVTEAVSAITWSGGNIAAGQYQNFDVSVGPLPDKATNMVFKALQTYSDGAVVRWIDLTSPGGQEPEHPAPVLQVKKAAVTGVTATTGTARPSSQSSDSTDWVSRVLAGLALLVAVGLALVQFARRTAVHSDKDPAPASVPGQRKTGTRV